MIEGRGCRGNIPNYTSYPALHGELHVTTSMISQTPPVKYTIKVQLLLWRYTRSSDVASFTKVEGHKLGLPIRLKDVHLHYLMTFIKDPVMHLVSNITIIIHIIHFLKKVHCSLVNTTDACIKLYSSCCSCSLSWLNALAIITIYVCTVSYLYLCAINILLHTPLFLLKISVDLTSADDPLRDQVVSIGYFI